MRTKLLLFISLFASSYLFAQPANDECINAIALPDLLEFCTNQGQYSNMAATASFTDYPACIREEDQNRDVWFSFVAQATDVSIQLIGNEGGQIGGSLLTPQFLLYEGSCDALNDIGCVSVIVGQNSLSGIFTNLSPGQTYYINVGARLGRQGSFQICLNQFNAVPAPSGDCASAVILCDKSPFSVAFLSGNGSVNDDLGDLLCNTSQCAGVGEANSAWYKWTCDQPGTLTFTIDPLGPPLDDIDFLLYELPGGIDNCNSKQNIRCMLSGQTQGNTDPQNDPCLGSTGLSLTDNDDREECGCQPGNNNFAQAITMVAGRSYALLIMNFSNSGAGFGITFGGTGTFQGPQALIQRDLGQACVGESVVFSDNSQSVDPIVRQDWNFGPFASPTTATGPGPHTVVFNRPGNQFVRMVVETNRGCRVTEIQSDLEIVCCESQFSVNETVIDLPCADDRGAINVAASSSYAPLIFAWSNGANTPNINDLPLGTYTLTITDQSSCTTTRSYQVQGPPPYTFDTLITMPTCDGGQDGALTLVVGGGTPGYTYSFGGSPFSMSNTLNNIPVGTYNVRVRDANDCEVSQDIFVNELVLQLDPNVVLVEDPRCLGESNGRISVVINNGLGPYTYDFNDGNGFQDNQVLSNIPAGSYRVNVRDANNCQGDFTFSVIDPPLLVAATEAEDISCFGEVDGSIGTQVQGGRPTYSYAWSNGFTTASINNLAAGTYALTITDSGGCPIQLSAIIQEPTEIFSSIRQIIDNICFGESNGSITLNASGGTGPYTFSQGDGNFQAADSLINLAAGDYQLVIMDSEGCTDTLAASIAQPNEFTIDAGLAVLLNLGFDTTLTAVSNYSPVTFSWAPEESASCLNLDCSRVLVRPFTSTTYLVTGINEVGCLATASVQLRVINDKPVFIPNVFSPNGDGLNDGFTLFAGPAVESIEQLQIFHRWGGLVYESAAAFEPNEPSLGWDGTLAGKALNNGVYVYQFRVRFRNGETGLFAGDVTLAR